MAAKKKPALQAKEDKVYPQLEAKRRDYDREHYVVYAKDSSRVLYWLALLALVVFNFLIFLLLVPLAIFLDSFQRHAVAAAVGLVFGLVFNFLVIDIEHLEPRHHLTAALLIPIVAALNLFIMTSLTNIFRGIWELPQAGGALTESAAYAALFLAPYLYSLWRGKIRAR